MQGGAVRVRGRSAGGALRQGNRGPIQARPGGVSLRIGAFSPEEGPPGQRAWDASRPTGDGRDDPQGGGPASAARRRALDAR